MAPSETAQCEVCGADTENSLRITVGGRQHVFDCIGCAILRLAPVCRRCGCRIIGHGIEARGSCFCSAFCLHQELEPATRPRISDPPALAL